MKRKVKELKRIARGNLIGNYSETIRAAVLSNLIISLVELPFSFTRSDVTFSTSNLIYYAALVLIGIASVVLTAGQYRIHLQTARNGKANSRELFSIMKTESDRFIFTQVIMFVLSLIAMTPVFGAVALFLLFDSMKYYTIALALGITGCILLIYLSLTFDLVYFAMIDDENLSMLKALKYTKELVHTHRKRYLYLQLSFIGMLCLGVLSFGIGMLWVHPYMVQTITLFYLDVKGELNTVLENRKKNGPTPAPTVINHYA